MQYIYIYIYGGEKRIEREYAHTPVNTLCENVFCNRCDTFPRGEEEEDDVGGGGGGEESGGG